MKMLFAPLLFTIVFAQVIQEFGQMDQQQKATNSEIELHQLLKYVSKGNVCNILILR